MKSSCIIHPPKERFFIIRERQVEFFNGNSCAAAIMSWLEYRQNGKLFIDDKNKRMNDIAEMHGDTRALPEDTYINFTISELIEIFHHTFGRNKIIDSLKQVEQLGVISIHANPNKKYHYDKSRYIRFYSEVYNQWLLDQGYLGSIQTSGGRDSCHDAKSSKFEGDDAQVVDSSDRLKLNNRDCNLDDASFNNKLSTSQNERDLFKIKRYIKNINKNINNNQLITKQDNSINEKVPSDLVQSIINALTQQGFPIKRFDYPDTYDLIHAIVQRGANVNTFLEAYDVSLKSTKHGNFGIKYITKVVDGLLTKKQQKKGLSAPDFTHTHREPVDNAHYENDLSKGLSWIDGDN